MSFAVLRDRTFKPLFASQVISLLGTGLATIALALMVYEQFPEQASLVLGSVLAVKMVAYLCVAPVVGAYVHLFPRRTWLASLNVIRALIIASLPWVEGWFWLSLWIFLLNVCAAAYTPVYQALLPDVLEHDSRYTEALSLSRLAMELESLLSPLFAALILLALPYALLFELNALAFVIASVLVAKTSLPEAKLAERSTGVWHQVSYGVRSYWHTPRLRAVLWLNGAVSAAGAMAIVNTVVYVKDHLGLVDAFVPLAMGALGLGAMLCALILPSLLRKMLQRSVMICGGLLASLVLITGTAQPSFLGLVLCWFMVGIASSFVLVPTGLVLKRSCQEGDRNAFFSANFALTHGLWLLCYTLAGSLAHYAGMIVCFSVLALIALGFTVFAWRTWQAEDHETLWHEHPEQNHDHPHYHDEHHQHDHEGWEGPEPHVHSHRHPKHSHSHGFTIDEHHLKWPN